MTACFEDGRRLPEEAIGREEAALRGAGEGEDDSEPGLAVAVAAADGGRIAELGRSHRLGEQPRLGEGDRLGDEEDGRRRHVVELLELAARRQRRLRVAERLARPAGEGEGHAEVAGGLHEGGIPGVLHEGPVDLDDPCHVARTEEVVAPLGDEGAPARRVGDRSDGLEEQAVRLFGAGGHLEDGGGEAVRHGRHLGVPAGEGQRRPEDALDVARTPVHVDRVAEEEGRLHEPALFPGGRGEADGECVVLVAVGDLRCLQEQRRPATPAVQAPDGHAQDVAGTQRPAGFGHLGERPAQSLAPRPREVGANDFAVERVGEAHLRGVRTRGGVEQALLLEALDRLGRGKEVEHGGFERLGEGGQLEHLPLGAGEPLEAPVDEVPQAGRGGERPLDSPDAPVRPQGARVEGALQELAQVEDVAAALVPDRLLGTGIDGTAEHRADECLRTGGAERLHLELDDTFVRPDVVQPRRPVLAVPERHDGEDAAGGHEVADHRGGGLVELVDVVHDEHEPVHRAGAFGGSRRFEAARPGAGSGTVAAPHPRAAAGAAPSGGGGEAGHRRRDGAGRVLHRRVHPEAGEQRDEGDERHVGGAPCRPHRHGREPAQRGQLGHLSRQARLADTGRTVEGDAEAGRVVHGSAQDGQLGVAPEEGPGSGHGAGRWGCHGGHSPRPVPAGARLSTRYSCARPPMPA